jgi:CHASE2 domain-containing sensor protein
LILSCLILAIPARIAAIFPEQLAFAEFNLSDILFSLQHNPRYRSEIVLIDCGEADRGRIAKAITVLEAGRPKVVGLDFIFNCPDGVNDTATCPQIRDSKGVLELSLALQKNKNIVLASALRQSLHARLNHDDDPDSLELADPIYSRYADNGFTNLVSNGGHASIIREFSPSRRVQGEDVSCFSLIVARSYDASAAQQFLTNSRPEEIINYSGNISHSIEQSYRGIYQVYEIDDLFSGQYSQGDFQDKIVLLGFLGGTSRGSMDDKFFTPINPVPLGRSYPDMYGLVIHANIVSQILDGIHIRKLNFVEECIAAFLFGLVQIVLLTTAKRKSRKWFFMIAVLAMMAMLALSSLLRTWLFIEFGLISDFQITFVTILISALILNTYDAVLEKPREG